MTDYKALCADLHAAFNTYAVCEEHHELLQRTRTAIAQPEPCSDIPKNCQLDDEPGLYPSPCVFDDPEECIDNCVYACKLQASGKPKTDCKYYSLSLAQPEQPVAVSERLPGPEDCDAEGRCWWYGEGGDMVGWTLDAEGPSYYRAKYWLPAHALPVPAND
jgi:hypothetical protein